MPLKYSSLTALSRKQIWKNFIGETDGASRVGALTEAEYDVLAETDINGRQIKNVVRTAKSLAQFQGQALDVEKLLHVVRIQQEFEDEMEEEEDQEVELMPRKESKMANGSSA